MVNPKAILDSPHVGLAKCTGFNNTYRSQDPIIKYLQDIHKKAFEAVMLMWGKKPLKNYGARMTESILSILRHILRGEKLIKERTEEETTEDTSTTSTSGTAAAVSRAGSNNATTERRDDPEADVNAEHLRQLMDMGFSRAHCVEALLHTLSVEQATDYLLSNPATQRRPDVSVGDVSGQGPIMDLDFTDDQVMYAIAMSLGDSDTRKSTEEPRDVPITQTIDEFTGTALEQCLNLLDLMPDTVYRICDLLVTITKRNGEEWRDTMLRHLIRDIGELVDYLIDVAESAEEDAGVRLVECEQATKVAGRIYLYTLFFEGTFQEMRVPCAQIVEESGILNKLVDLLVASEGPLTSHKVKLTKECKDGQMPVIKTPKWLAPLLLLIDRLEKVAVLTQRKQLMHKVTNKVWKWFDLSSGKWTAYSPLNNRLINDAYWAGEPSVRINCSRRRYLITFSCMTQVNEDSDNRRPITMDFKFQNASSDDASSGSDSNMDTEETPSEEKRNNTVVQGLNPIAAPTIVSTCVKLLAIPVDRDTLHALMKVCLRLTRDYNNAQVFAKEGGVKLLLEMTQASSFIGCISLSTLLIRHTLEEPQTLRLAMEKVVRSRTQTNIPPAYKEILFMTRQISSAVCRNPEVYREVCDDILRVDISVLKKDDTDNRLVVKALPSNHSSATPMVEEISISVVHDLLNALIKPVPVFPDDNTATPTGTPEKKSTNLTTIAATAHGVSATSSRRTDGTRNNASTANGPLDDDDQIVPLKMYTDYMSNGKVEPEEAKKPLLSKSAILKMLAESIRSYGAVANLIAEHTYRANQSEMVSEEITALGFLLDKLLPILPENSGDRQCSSMARMLIAAIASCNHSPDAQTTLVTEVKAALLRTLTLPESSEKHAQLQLIIGLISTMIDSCPPTSHTPLRVPSKVHQYNNVNYIVRIMLKKGIITDLAKIPHSLDLSSPNMAGTINAALKPLETLSRIINQPMPGTVNNKFPKPKNRTVQDEPIGDQTGTTTSEATHAVGEETNEDAENTEHDISLNAESLEPTSESQVHEEGDEAALEDIMDQLLERDGSAVTEEPTSRSHRPMDIDDESLAMRDTDGDFDPTRDTTEDLMSSDSDSDSNQSDDNEDDVQDDDDDDEEEEEEEDDGEENEEEDEEEEESSNYGEEDHMGYIEGISDAVRMMASAERDVSNVVMIPHNYDNHDNNAALPTSTRPNHSWSANFPLPVSLFEDLPSVSESNGIGSHPLLLGSGGSLDIANSRAQRALRQRRYQYLQIANPRNSNSPVILQRLLVPAAQTLPMSASQVLASGFRDTRVVVMDNSLGIFSNQEEEQIDFVDQSGYLFGPSLAATLNNIPTALHWWIEESKLLDGDSQPDCCVGIVHKLISKLEKQRNAELAERKDKRKKQQNTEKDTEKDSKDAKDSSKTRESGSSVIVTSPQAEQQQPSGSVLIRANSRRLADTVEAAVEAVGENTNREDNVIEITGEMEVTVQDDEERTPPPPPPPPPPEEQIPDTRNPLTILNAPLELAESLIDSVLQPSTEEATRLRRLNSNRDSDEMNLNRSYNPLPESRDPDAWVQRLLGIDQSRRENNANISIQDPSSSSSTSDNIITFTEQSQAQSTESPETPTEQQPTQQPGQSQAQAQQQSSQELQLPDGVDPSFLAALPDEMRDEVIAEQLRLQRIRQRTQATVVEEVTGPVEVNPEFLAALPPAIQEEVLAQQRLEQQRHAAASANPADPVDAAAFFQNLQPSLRQAILTDMEESQMSVLPPDLAEEAQNLRRQWEARNRHLMQERFLNHVSQGSTALSSILRNSGRGRGGGTRYAIHSVTQRAQWNSWNPRGETSISHQSAGLRLRGRQLLDHESMACLLVLLFVDEPKINTLRLHRVIRNLCYHTNTREWVVKALLNIMERSNDENKEIMNDFTGKFKRKTAHSSIDYCSPKSDSRNNLQSWLNISIDAALGCRANVFHILRHTGKKSERIGSTIAIHPQAAPTVFVRRSSQLTDKLLRLLSLISIGLTEVNSYRRQDAAKNKKVEPSKEQSVAAPEGHLRLAVQVLTSKSCSEEGLEDATALLLNLSHCPDPTRQLILKLLLEGAMELANMVCDHISELMKELKVLNLEIRRRNSLEDQPSTSASVSGRGNLTDRFTQDSVVITAPSKVKAGTDLQLPSMSALVSKTSSQAFFLRILKVIVQIREAVYLANKKKNETAQHTETAMETTVPSTQQAQETTVDDTLPLLSESLVLDNLWETLSACLLELEHTPDHHAVLVLQPAVEAFFLVHSSSSTSTRDRNNETNAEPREAVADIAPVSPSFNENEGQSQNETANTIAAWDMTPAPPKSLPSDQLKFLKFAETHRTVLNQILRQTTTHLADGPFSVLVDHTRVLDFDVKRRYFRTELERMDEGIRREELAVHVRRSHVFEDSFRELHRRNADEWKNRFYIVFEGEEGQDAGGLLREWYVIISREIFNPMYALFTVSPGDRVTYMINSSSHCNPNHLCYYKFVGRVIAKAIYDNKLLECYFTRSFYKHILGILVKHTDMESEDYSFYKGLVYLTENNISDLGYELTFSAEVNEFGVNDVRDLVPNGRNIVVTEDTKLDYIRLVCQMKMTGAIRKQLNSFLEGFYDIIPKRLISIFNEQELELLISGLPNIQWFWRALRGFDQADRAKFLQFVTGTSKVPLQGFGALEGMNGVQKFQIHRDDRSTDRLPSAHTCFNQLDLPVYETYDKLRSNLLKAIHECSEGFGFA
ncbi:GSCOCG00005556001-RA-CDS [Cotesia congregata]|nr:GSCOCG00005556001-RA-CDS [Cotesia congregata]